MPHDEENDSGNEGMDIDSVVQSPSRLGSMNIKYGKRTPDTDCGIDCGSSSSSGASSLASSSSSSSQESSSGSDGETSVSPSSGPSRPKYSSQMSTDSAYGGSQVMQQGRAESAVLENNSALTRYTFTCPQSEEHSSSIGNQSPGHDVVDQTNGPPEPPNDSLPALEDPYNIARLVLLMRLSMHRFFTFPSLVIWNRMYQNLVRQDLANSGFFFTADESSIQCYYCRLKVYDPSVMDHDESVDDVHKRLSPDCSLMKGEALVDVPISDPTNYRYESHRLYSLLITVWDAPISAYDLAKYGFYWTGSSDNCRCAFCRLEVRGWEEGDRAEAEHRRWNPNCVFINGRSVGNVEIGKELDSTALVNDEAGSRRPSSAFSINPFARSELSSYGQIKYTKGGRQMPVETLGVTPMNPPRHADYMTLGKRMDSYKLWPMCLPQRPEQLAEAGFYYTGTGDRVICFQCGGGLKDWAPSDTPWCEHAKWFSRCPYLLLKRGKEYVDQTLRDQKIEMPLQAFTDDQKAQKQQKERDLAEEAIAKPAATNSLRCRKCGERDVETVNLPCGHMVTCEACVDQETKCSRCGVARVAYVRTFLQ